MVSVQMVQIICISMNAVLTLKILWDKFEQTWLVTVCDVCLSVCVVARQRWPQTVLDLILPLIHQIMMLSLYAKFANSRHWKYLNKCGFFPFSFSICQLLLLTGLRRSRMSTKWFIYDPVISWAYFVRVSHKKSSHKILINLSSPHVSHETSIFLECWLLF